MTDITYRIVEHDGGWAYKLGEVFSETFPTRDLAVKTAHRVAAEQERPGSDATIQYEDEQGRWREERSVGEDRPHTHVQD